jgi:enamine deaminase RidA (YjgF/YER057c/UK114 family)
MDPAAEQIVNNNQNVLQSLEGDLDSVLDLTQLSVFVNSVRNLAQIVTHLSEM